MLKNIAIYYLFMFVPVLVFIYFGKQINSSVFLIFLFTYLLVYRPIIDRLRLLHKGVITREKALRFYFPGVSYYYFKELYLP